MTINRKIKNRLKNKGGISLLELMITVFVLSVGIMGSLMYFATSISSAEMARDITTATTHAEYILEEMQTRNSLADITSQDWSAWAVSAGLDTLPNESVSVTYVDTGADPLDITATVSWTRKSGTKNVSFTTQLTK